MRLAGVPALLCHPDWTERTPVVLWMHGRTVNKELDPGRYLRWVRAGIAACAIDLPGHGERYIEEYQGPARTLDMLGQVDGEIDGVLEALFSGETGEMFDRDRMGIGGMSAGGMATLVRLCRPHQFRCAAVEATTGSLRTMYFDRGGEWSVKHDPARVAQLDPVQRLDGFRPVPLLALHAESDRVVPVESQRAFVASLREHYTSAGSAPDLVEMHTWADTGAPEEHAGFGRYSNDAKNLQVEFLARCLDATPIEL